MGYRDHKLLKFYDNAGGVWHFLREADWERLDRAPDAMPPGSAPVKHSGLRAVFRKNGFFLKTELSAHPRSSFCRLRNTFFPKARSEFNSLLDLRDAGIPAVEPVAWTQFDGISWTLVTREMSEVVTANDFFHTAVGRDGRKCAEFFAAWCGFVRAVLDSGFDHPDFHNGNILYCEKKLSFALVDVYGVRRRLFPRRRRMAMIVREFAQFLSKPELLKLIADCGIPDGETFYRDMLRYDAQFIRREWKRRKKQFFADYPKFVAVEGERRWTLNGAREKLSLANTEKLEFAPEKTAELRRRDFLLSLLRLPRLRIVAFDPPGTLYRETAAGEASPEGVADLRERLQFSGLDPDDYGFAADRFGRTVLVPKG